MTVQCEAPGRTDAIATVASAPMIRAPSAPITTSPSRAGRAVQSAVSISGVARPASGDHCLAGVVLHGPFVDHEATVRELRLGVVGLLAGLLADGGSVRRVANNACTQSASAHVRP